MAKVDDLQVGVEGGALGLGVIFYNNMYIYF